MSNTKSEMRTYSGLPTARGLAMGPVFIYRGVSPSPIPAYLVDSGLVDNEVLRLDHARFGVRRDLENLIAALRDRGGADDVSVFECHRMLLDDPLLISESNGYIRNDRLNAEAAVHRTFGATREKFERMNDDYFRERVRDIIDVERRLQRALAGSGEEIYLELKTPSIVIADDLTPSETVQLPRENVLGFATNKGSVTSHVALLARALGIPAVTGLVDIAEKVTAGAKVLLNGTTGEVVVNPDSLTIDDFRNQITRQRELIETIPSGVPAGTLKSGGEVIICANLHPGMSFEGVKNLGARGVGLYRSEYLWLNRELEPTEDEQFAAYREAAEFTLTLGRDASLIIRALDIGGDKLVRGISETEANPFLGNRSIRYLLSHRDVFVTQLRAVLRASAFGRVSLMFPMISCVEEIIEAKKILESVKDSLTAEQIPYDPKLRIGAMIEVPAAAINARALAKNVDFFSIGTNDLVQYTMAADRGNESVAYLYQPLNPAVLSLVRGVIAAAEERGIEVSVCGESAADPIIGVLWAAMGVKKLSVTPAYIPTMSKLFSLLSRADLDEYARLIEGVSCDMSAADVLARCREFMRSKIPDFDNL